MNIFQYAASEEKMWENKLAELGSYKRQTTFYADLSIAEMYGIKSIKDTYKNVVEQWSNNVKYFTEFVLCLNHKSWEWYERANRAETDKDKSTCNDFVQLYAELYEKAKDLAYDTFDKKGQQYLWEVLD